MSTIKHTPGPWHVELDGYDSDGGYIVEGAGVRAESGLFVAAIEPHDEAHADIAANARLIAAAPELLAALQLIAAGRPFPAKDRSRDATAQNIAWERCAAIARAAISKAVGSARDLPARNELERESGRREGE